MKGDGSIIIKIGKEQTLIFDQGQFYEVEVYTDCKNPAFINKSTRIENVTIYNSEVNKAR